MWFTTLSTPSQRMGNVFLTLVILPKLLKLFSKIHTRFSEKSFTVNVALSAHPAVSDKDQETSLFVSLISFFITLALFIPVRLETQFFNYLRSFNVTNQNLADKNNIEKLSIRWWIYDPSYPGWNSLPFCGILAVL